VEITRKLVESDGVLFLSGGLGTPTNSAIWHYTNGKKGFMSSSHGVACRSNGFFEYSKL
jgi:hypothetical protein